MRQSCNADRTFRQSQAVAVAKAIWDSAEPAKADHAHLRRNGIKPYGVRVIKDSLIIPVTDRGRLISLQYIHSNGTTRFMPNGRTRGGYYTLGQPSQADTICIAESFAASSYIHEATGYPVLISFYSENLAHVIRTAREIYPLKTLVICPDEDCLIDEGSDITKAGKSFCSCDIHAEQMHMARRIGKLKSPDAMRRQAHLLCRSLIELLRT